jgi:hypothetical protein
MGIPGFEDDVYHGHMIDETAIETATRRCVQVLMSANGLSISSLYVGLDVTR